MRIFQTLIDESINILPSLCFEIEKKISFGEYLRVFKNSKLIKHGPVVWLFYNSCCKISRTFCLENRLNPPENKFC